MLDALRRRMSGIAKILRTPDPGHAPAESRAGSSSVEPGARPGSRMVDRSPLYVFCLDQPTTVPIYERFVVKGWIAAMQPILDVRLASGGELQEMPRPDVVAALGTRFAHVRGFRGWFPSTGLRQASWLDFELDLGGERHQCLIELAAPGEAAPLDEAAKRRKLDRIRPILRSDLPRVETPSHFDFLAPEHRKHGVVDTEDIPSARYDDLALGIVREFRDGLILDAGAGLRREQYENVVNLEIMPYASTDVLSGIEDLPFSDASFDAVFSFAVLEHVQDPFRCARELYRVLKPGGKLYANVPFLQPYHGYPHHYYNMTSQGLANLFPAGLEVVSTAVPPYGLPIWTLWWMVNTWSQALPVADREELLDMRVRDLLTDPHEYLERGFVKNLPARTNFELASLTGLLGIKR